MKHVIIGAGAAGLSAAKTIRTLRPHDEIVVISEDWQITSRCMLYKCINGERDSGSISFVKDNFFESFYIKWLNNTAVTAVDTALKTVRFGSDRINYDKLLIASGAEAAVPPIGALRHAQNTFVLRRLSDVRSIRNAAKNSSQAIIIGAGLVGLDAAYALLDLKKNVTVIEMEPHILPLNLDERSSKAYQDLFEAAGCKFRLGRKVVSTSENSRSLLTRVNLDDGSSEPCEFLIVAVGMLPAIDFLAGSGVAHGIALKVNSRLATNIPDVYAAGDVTGLSGIWPNAMRQGVVAAKNMCGFAEEYTDMFATKYTINLFGLQTMTVGKTIPEEGDDVIIREDVRNYKKFILRDGRVKGVILQGDISGGGFWQHMVKNDLKADNFNRPIWKLSYADFCSFDEKGEYLKAV